MMTMRYYLAVPIFTLIVAHLYLPVHNDEEDDEEKSSNWDEYFKALHTQFEVERQEEISKRQNEIRNKLNTQLDEK